MPLSWVSDQRSPPQPTFCFHHSLNSEEKLCLDGFMSKKDQIWTFISLEIVIQLVLCPKFKQHWY